MDRLLRFFAIAECRVHDANSLQVCSQTTVSCSQPEYSGLLMSCQTVDWVSRGVVVASGGGGDDSGQDGGYGDNGADDEADTDNYDSAVGDDSGHDGHNGSDDNVGPHRCCFRLYAITLSMTE